MSTTRKTFCRICQALCGIEVDLDDGQVRAVRGDFEHPMSRGYTCEKGRQLGAHLHNPQRLRGCLERRADGSFAPIASALALDAIGERLRTILERHGPRAIATYAGTAAYMNGAAIGITRVSRRSARRCASRRSRSTSPARSSRSCGTDCGAEAVTRSRPRTS
ncbi:MAG: hypothetical protein IPH83_13480 [Gammaproteobacteria bacterium]|nr:hypothetical protein [Gammaproteobacteria bacterium]